MVLEIKGFAREMVSNCNVGATMYTVCKRAREELEDMIVGNHKIHYLHHKVGTSDYYKYNTALTPSSKGIL